MKQGMSLHETVAALERWRGTIADFVADPRRIEVRFETGEVELYGTTPSDGAVWAGAMTPTFDRQLTGALGIPRAFHDRLVEEGNADVATGLAAELLARRKRPALLRTIDRHARAFLSPSYRVLDNRDVLAGAIQALEAAGHRVGADRSVVVRSIDVDYDRLFMKASFPLTRRDWRVGEPVEIGFVLKNSEVGDGALVVRPLLHFLVCLNGMVAAKAGPALRKVHRVAGPHGPAAG